MKLKTMNIELPDDAIDSVYVSPDPEKERWVVSLVASYGVGTDVVSPEQAVAAALSLTQDLGSPGTMWFVYDRQTGKRTFIEQGDVEALAEEMG